MQKGHCTFMQQPLNMSCMDAIICIGKMPADLPRQSAPGSAATLPHRLQRLDHFPVHLLEEIKSKDQ